jgi:hypothetical protein
MREYDHCMVDIRFYDEFAEHGWLSNFASCPIFLDGKLWPTTEHYYQAMKYAGAPYEESVRCAPSPLVAKTMTRDPAHPPRADWDAVKDAVMLAALRAKFAQHAHLRASLLATGSARLIEHTPNDAYWADGGDGSGLNRLGELLMRVREDLRAGG